MPRLLFALCILCLVAPSLSYDRRAAEEELRFLSQNAQTYLTEVLIWVAVFSVLIFAMILCICDLAIRMLCDRCCSKKSEDDVDVEASLARYSSRLSMTGEGYYTNVPLPTFSRRAIYV